MKYEEFKETIRNKNIHLFDAYSRIIYFKLFNNNLQVGGGNKLNIKHIIKKLNMPVLKIFLESVYDNNTIRFNYIINNYY
jgi:hypothetical protein